MVLPSLSPLSSRTSAQVEVPPPPNFRAPRGAIRDVSFQWTDFRVPPDWRNLSAAQRNGLRYEDQVQSYLSSSVGYTYAPSPMIWFTDDSGRRFVVPDGLIIHDGQCWDERFVVVVEVKSQHMPEAWWQLKRLYQPVLKSRNPELKVLCLEVVRSYDPAMPFPCPVELVRDLKEWLRDPSSDFAVLEWKP